MSRPDADFSQVAEELIAAAGSEYGDPVMLDLCSEQGRHVMFTYGGDSLSTISTVHVPHDA